jgi:SAM-dependent methyltransferase
MTATPELALNAERTLRPTEADLASAWREVVRANAEQEARLRETDPFDDYWAPGRRDHPIYNVEISDVSQPTDFASSLAHPDDVWLDIGAGSGRETIYLSQFVRKILAVDPSPGMTALLKEHVDTHSGNRVEVLEADAWPPSRQVPIVDVSYTQSVTYFTEDITGFLDAMESHARRLCIIGANHRGTGWRPVESLFEAIHGEPFVSLTGAPELIAVLLARGRSLQMTSFPTPIRGPEDLDSAHARVRDDYYLRPGSDKDRLLKKLLEDHFGIGEGKVRMPTPPGKYQSIISWEPPA